MKNPLSSLGKKKDRLAAKMKNRLDLNKNQIISICFTLKQLLAGKIRIKKNLSRKVKPPLHQKNLRKLAVQNAAAASRFPPLFQRTRALPMKNLPGYQKGTEAKKKFFRSKRMKTICLLIKSFFIAFLDHSFYISFVLLFVCSAT